MSAFVSMNKKVFVACFCCNLDEGWEKELIGEVVGIDKFSVYVDLLDADTAPEDEAGNHYQWWIPLENGGLFYSGGGFSIRVLRIVRVEGN